MSQSFKLQISKILSITSLSVVLIILLYSCIYCIWNQYNNRLFNREGQRAVATIIRKDNGRAQYDIEYEGRYYRRWVNLSKKAFRAITVGERFEALILPDLLKYDHESGITPRYIKIILTPLPLDKQDFLEEEKRIESMYGYKK